MKKFSSDAVVWFNTITAIVAMTIIAVLVCSCTTTEHQTNADKYIQLLEGELTAIKGDNYILDCVSGTDEYNAYYNN